MIRETTFLNLDPAVDGTGRDDLLATLRRIPEEVEVRGFQASPTGTRAVGGGDLMLVMAFDDLDGLEVARAAPYFTTTVLPLLATRCRHVETVRYRQGPVRVLEPDLRDGVHRTLCLHVDGSTPPEQVEAFERDLAAMGDYIGTIRNSSLSRVDTVEGPTGPRWTHVWEQEYATLDGLLGEYMEHPYHWAWVDLWFELEAGKRVVDPRLIHSMCDLDRSILGRATS